MSNSDFWVTGNSDVIPLLQQMLCMEPNNEAHITLLKPNNVRVITTLLNYNVKFIILWSYSITAIKLAAKKDSVKTEINEAILCNSRAYLFPSLCGGQFPALLLK